MARKETEQQKQERLFIEQLGEISQKYLECRVFGHSRRPFILDEDALFPILGWKCENCGMCGEVYRNQFGQRVSRSWHPLQNYFFKGTGRMTAERRAIVEEYLRDELRGTMLTRWPEDDER